MRGRNFFIALFIATSLFSGVTTCFSDDLFSPYVSYYTGYGPKSVVSGDFNRDGDIDLVTANSDGGNVSILIGNGDGSFQSDVAFSVGTNPNHVIADDFNGDGNLDLATSNSNLWFYGPSSVTVLLGNGDGTFGEKVYYDAGKLPSDIISGDFNGDGNLDLATTNYHYNSVSILLGNGDGTFQPNIDSAAGPNPYSVASGDFNGDGKVDLATGNWGHVYKGLSILLGNGDGTFQPNIDYNIGKSPHDVLTGDFNGDGKVDIATANNEKDQALSILLGNGDGSFQSNIDYASSGSALSIARGDFNDDGITDLVTSNYYLIGPQNSVSIFLGYGDGSFQPNKYYMTHSGRPFSVTTGDFNRDGKEDLVTAEYYSRTVSILLNIAYAEETISKDITSPAIVSNNAGTASVAIYPGCLSKNTTIKIIGETDLSNFSWGSNQQALSTLYTFTASPSSNFIAPVTITLFYDQGHMLEGGMTEQLIAIYYYNTSTQQWEAQDAVKNMLTNTLTLDAWHFSTYAAITNKNPVANVLQDLEKTNGISDGIRNSLRFKAEKAYKLYEDGKFNAIFILNAFKFEVEGLSGRKIDFTSASVLIQSVENTISELQKKNL